MKLKILFSLLFLFCFLLVAQTQAQWQKMPKSYNIEQYKKDLPKLLGANSVGKEFWVTFIPCDEQAGPVGSTLKVYISSGVQTTVTLEIPGKGYYIQRPTIPNDIIEFSIDPAIGQPYRKTETQASEPDAVYSGFGLHIYADDPIIVYGVTRFTATSDSYLGLPVSSLGKEYIVASYADFASGTGSGGILPSETACVAAYDKTVVRFTLGGTNYTTTAGGMKSGETISKTLYKGDVWLITGYGNLADLSGSKWRSTKPVAVVSGNYCANIPSNVRACDFIDEMELPTNTWGTEYHVTPIKGRLKNSYVKIFAKFDNTVISREGQYLGTIRYAGGKEGEGFLHQRVDESTPPRPIVISGDKPISVTQYNPGQLDDGITSDPFQMILSPIEQYQREIIFNTPGIKGGYGFASNYINICYRTNDDGTMPQDLEFATVQSGKFVWIPIASFSPEPGQPFSSTKDGKKYAAKQMVLPADGVYKIRANNPFCAYAYGFSFCDSYGHPTSVALGDLEKPDTLAPDPKWVMECNGDVHGGTLGQPNPPDATVEDMPRNDDRSNLSMIYFDSQESFNYRFSYKDFIPGESSMTTWKAWVSDPSKDARAVITFSDRRGNDTTIVIDYKPKVFYIRPDLNFGRLSIGESKDLKTWIVNLSSTDKPVDVQILKLKFQDQGFSLVSPDSNSLPVWIPPHDSIQLTVRFLATQNGEYKDSIGCGDTCFFGYKAEIKAEVGSARINVSFYDFGDVAVNKTAQGSIEIKNEGTVSLNITSFTDPLHVEFQYSGLPAMSVEKPLVIAPGKSFNYQVSFTPTKEQRYTDSMFFISNTEKVPIPVDSVGDLFGRGIKADIIATGYDWKERLINRPNFPTGPYAATKPDGTPDSVITFTNVGSMPVTIRTVKRVIDTLGNAFIFDKGAIEGAVIPDSSKLYVPVQFQPTQTGEHILVLEFDNTASTDPNSLPRSTLHGIGVVPRLKTSDIVFDTTVVGNTAHPSVKKVRFSLLDKSEWQYTFDSVTIKDFTIGTGSTDIATDLTSFGNKGYRFDKAALNMPVVLKLDTVPEHRYVEFDAEFVAPGLANPYLASLATQSDAETEVTSNWSGNGKDMSIIATGASANICCVGDIEMISKISNNGTEDVRIDSIAIIPSNSNSTGVFRWVTPSDAQGFVLTANTSRDIDILYIGKSDNADTLITLISQHKATLNYYWTKNDTVRIDSCQLLGSTRCFRRGTAIGLTANKIRIDDDVFISFNLQEAPLHESTSDAAITDINVDLSYNGTVLKVINEGIQLGGLLQGKWQMSPIKIKDLPGQISFTLSAIGNEVFDNISGGELLNVRFHTYLPPDSNRSSLVNFSFKPTKLCLKIAGSTDTLNLEEICRFDLRKVTSTSSTYMLKAIRPNPVTGDKAEINFSIAWDGYTEVRIFNSNSELISVPVKSELEKGEYTVDLDVSNLNSGVYWYEITAGPFRKMEKMVVVK